MEYADALVGRRVADLKGIFYIYEDGEVFDSCEIIFADGGSCLFSSATDWTLRVTPGGWPKLPGWCYPLEAWEFSDLGTELGLEGWREIIRVKEVLNEKDEFSRIELMFKKGVFLVGSGDSVSFEVIPL